MEVSGKKQRMKLSSTFLFHGSEEDFKLFCIPCFRVGPRKPAFGFCTNCKEHQCQNCFNHHKVATLSRNHVLLNKGSMPKTQQPNFDKKDNSSSDLTKPCLRHKNKLIEYYCLSHRKLLCNVCVTLEHNPSSCNVKFIPDISDKIIDSRELRNITEHMDTIMGECQLVGKTSKDLTERSNNSLDKACRDLKMWRIELNNRLDKMEKAVEEKARYLQQKNKQKVHNTETIFEDIGKSVKALKDNILQTNSAKQADKLFIDIKTAQQELYDYDACIRDLKEAEDVNEYQFKPNTSIINPLKTQKTFGILEAKQLPTKMTVKTPMFLEGALTLPRNRSNSYSRASETYNPKAYKNSKKRFLERKLSL